MVRARLLLSVIAALVFGGIIWMAFSPRAVDDTSSAASAFVQFAFVAALLVMLLGPRRWWVALGFAVLGASWIEAGQSVWMPPGYALVTDTLAGSAGSLVGALLALGVMVIAGRSNHRSASVEGVHSNQQG